MIVDWYSFAVTGRSISLIRIGRFSTPLMMIHAVPWLLQLLACCNVTLTVDEKGMRIVVQTPPVCAFLPKSSAEYGEISVCPSPCAPSRPTEASCKRVNSTVGVDSPST